MDDEVTLTDRRVYTIVEALSSTGGIIGFVYLIIEIMIRFI
jgi:hypothetical protein